MNSKFEKVNQHILVVVESGPYTVRNKLMDYMNTTGTLLNNGFKGCTSAVGEEIFSIEFKASEAEKVYIISEITNMFNRYKVTFLTMK